MIGDAAVLVSQLGIVFSDNNKIWIIITFLPWEIIPLYTLLLTFLYIGFPLLIINVFKDLSVRLFARDLNFRPFTHLNATEQDGLKLKFPANNDFALNLWKHY